MHSKIFSGVQVTVLASGSLRIFRVRVAEEFRLHTRPGATGKSEFKFKLSATRTPAAVRPARRGRGPQAGASPSRTAGPGRGLQALRLAKSTIDAIFTMRVSLQKRFRFQNLKDTWVLFVDFVKAFDTVPREMLFKVLASRKSKTCSLIQKCGM